MKKMEKFKERKMAGIMSFLIFFPLFVWSSILLWSGPVDKSVKHNASSIDVNKIEGDIEKLKKKVVELENSTGSSGTRLRRDPFATLIVPEKISPIIKEDVQERKKVLPDIVLYGIVSDGTTSLAIIGDEVKREGEFIGECEIYKIKEENVLIKCGDEIFPVYIKQ